MLLNLKIFLVDLSPKFKAGAGFSGTGMVRHGTVRYRCTTGVVQVLPMKLLQWYNYAVLYGAVETGP
jgi:hypothetical protein